MKPLVLLMIFFSCSASAAEIYRWVDENGKVHYSDTKPGQGEKAEEVKPQIRNPAEPDEGEIRRREYLKSADLLDAEKEAEERLSQPDRERQMAEGISQRRKAGRCREARVKYGVTFEEMPIYWTEYGDIRPDWSRDYYVGSREYIADKDRPAIRDQITDELYRYCDDPLNQDLQVAAYNDWVDQEYCRVEELDLEMALKPRTRTPDDEVERIRARIAQYCR